MFDFAAFNWIAIGVATVVAFLIGGIWYGPLFGKAWMDALGKTEADIQPTPTPFIVSAFTSLLTAIGMAMLVAGLNISDWIEGAVLGVIVGVGFIATAMASDAAFCGWSLRLWAIQSGYRVLYAIVMGAILGAWQ